MRRDNPASPCRLRRDKWENDNGRKTERNRQGDKEVVQREKTINQGEEKSEKLAPGPF